MERIKRRLTPIATWTWKHFRVIAGVLLVVGLAFALGSSGEKIAAVDWTIDPLTLGGAIVLLSGAGLAQALTLRIALRRLGAAAAPAATLRVWARSFVLRYEPSGAVGFVYRVRERERLGATTSQVLTATGYEQLAAVTAGALAALIGFLAAGINPPLLSLLLAGSTVLVALALRPGLLGDRLARWLSRRGSAMAGPLRGRTLALLVTINLAGWATTAAGAALLAHGLLGAAAPGAFLLLGAFGLSWVVGVLLPLLPGGLGPREAALTVALAGVTGAAAAAVLALALRVVSFAAELVAAAIAELAAVVLARRESNAAAIPELAAVVLARDESNDHAENAAVVLARDESNDRAENAAAVLARDESNDHAEIGPARAVGPAPRPSPTGARTIVVVPTYNEREALPLFVERFASATSSMELLVVDDSSPDGSGELADALAAARPWMHVLHRAEKDGLGMAYRAGFAWCLGQGYDLVGQMDCDLSHPPEKLEQMRSVLLQRDAGLVLGSRYLPGGGTDGWSRSRLALSRVGCRASRLMLGLPFSDLSGGFKLWRASCLAAIEMDELLSAGYAFQVETTQLAHLAGARIEEVPFVFSERVAGTSKMTLRISLEGIRVTLALRRNHRPPRRPSALPAL